jgi:hypothetical protein
MDFLAHLRDTGFVDVASAGETGFNSSPKTRGMLVRARKPGLQDQKSVVSSKTGEIHAPTDAEGASTKMSSKIDTLLQRAITPGAEKKRLIDTDFRIDLTTNHPYIAPVGKGSPSIPIFFRKRRPIHV